MVTFGVMKRLIYMSLLFVVAMTACNKAPYEPYKGDLLFVVGEESSEFSEAITKSTAHHEMLKYDHVAIVDVVGDSACVVEASSRGGVVVTPWNEFMESAKMADGRVGVVVKRVNVAVDVDAAVDAARAHLGEEYDWSFRPDNGKMYCSELVYESYLDNNGQHLFDANPMSFRDAEGNLPQFWIDLFDRLGEEVPEGVAGTNPTSMSCAEILIEVARFF